MGLYSLQGFERGIAVDADVSDSDLAAEIGEEAGEVDEILAVRDEEAVLLGHMLQGGVHIVIGSPAE